MPLAPAREVSHPQSVEASVEASTSKTIPSATLSSISEVPVKCKMSKKVTSFAKKSFEFIDTDNSGSISKEELKAALQKSCSREVPEQEIDQIFNRFDTNKDGEISSKEFQSRKASILSFRSLNSPLRDMKAGLPDFDLSSENPVMASAFDKSRTQQVILL